MNESILKQIGIEMKKRFENYQRNETETVRERRERARNTRLCNVTLTHSDKAQTLFYLSIFKVQTRTLHATLIHYACTLRCAKSGSLDRFSF